MERRAGQKKLCRGWLLKYTLLYLMVMLPFALIVLLSGKTLLWRLDAYLQHYPALAYTGEAVKSLLSGGGFKMVDTSLGQGLDVIGTFAYYGLFNPLQWLAAFFTGESLEICYNLLIYIYFYLIGLLMCVYTRTAGFFKREDGWLTAAAGLIFAFCGYHAMSLIRHPFFANGSIYLLLMLISVERLLKGRGFAMMSLVTALMLVSNYYFAFQTTLLVIFYILIRLAARFGARRIKGTARDGFALLGSYLLGLMLGMVVLLPAAAAFLQSGRTESPGGYSLSMLFYPAVYYLRLVLQFSIPYDYAGFWSFQSFSPLALFGLLVIFSRRNAILRNHDNAVWQLRAGYVCLLVCLCIPFVGKFFNGMGYVTNRWSYGYSLAVCLAAAWAMPCILEPEYRGRKKLAAFGFAWALVLLVYALIAHKIPSSESSGNSGFAQEFSVGIKNLAGIAGALAMGASALGILLVDRGVRMHSRRTARTLALLTACCCLAYTFGYAATAATSQEFFGSGIQEQIGGNAAGACAVLPDGEFYRVDAGDGTDNHASILGYNGTGFYWSVIPGSVTGHYMDLELSSVHWSFRLDGLGSDTYLNALAGVKYALREDTQYPLAMGYGYERVDTVARKNGDSVGVYENRYALPMGYVFDSVMTEADYAALGPVQKREALLSCAVLAGEDWTLDMMQEEMPVEKLPWELVEASGVEISEHEIHCSEGGMLTLRFNGRPDSLTYLHIRGLEVPDTLADDELRIDSLTAAGGARGYIAMPVSVFNYDQTGMCMSLGYSESGMEECTLRFNQDRVIHMEELEILSAPMDFYRDRIGEIQSRGVWNPQVENNRISGRIRLEGSGIMQISLPFSSGWTAYVDGQEAGLVRCGGMYMGLKLDAGEHDIEMRYVTPGLMEGAAVSLVGIAVLSAICACRTLRRRRRI